MMNTSNPRSPDPYAWSPPSDQFDPLDPGRGWIDPEKERAQDRSRIRLLMVGFGLLGIVLALVSITAVLGYLRVFRMLPRRLFPPDWDFFESTLVGWASFVGVCLLWGRWRDRAWQGRVGVLVLMGGVDLALWAAEHAVRLHLSDGPIGHEWFLYCVGHTLGWAELALIASLAGEVAVHLGRARVADAARGVRSLTNVGALYWLVVFGVSTGWQSPVWPLRWQPVLPLAEWDLLTRGETLLWTVSLVQVTILTFTASSCCATMLGQMNRDDRQSNRPDLPSEAAWKELNRERDRDRS